MLLRSFLPLTQESSQGKERFKVTFDSGLGKLPMLNSWAAPHSPVETVMNLWASVKGWMGL